MRDERIACVIVSFQPHLKSLLNNVQALNEQVDLVILVDNGSNNQSHLVESLKKINSLRLSLRCLTENLGVGTAQNHGIAIAKERGYDYVLLLDQDTYPDESMVDNLYDAVLQLKSSGEIDTLAAVGSRYYNSNGSESFFVQFGLFKFMRNYCIGCEHGILPADFLISSGSLIPLNAIEKIGSMDEKLFIDHVDTEWFLRAKSLGFKAYGVCSAVMKHGLGENTRKVKMFGLMRERNVPQHKPFRYYYMFRNSIALYRRKNISRKWKWNDSQRLLQIAVFYGIFFGPRWQNLKMMIKGIYDGLRNNMGKLSE